jgi:O-antigen ligase
MLLFGIILLSTISISWAFSDYYLAFKYTVQLVILFSFTVVAIKLLSHDEEAIKSVIFYWLIVSSIVSYYSLQGALSPNELSASKRIAFLDIGLNAIAISIGYVLILALAGFNLFINERIKQLIMIVGIFFCFWLLIRLGTRSVVWGVIFIFIIISILSFDIKKILVTSFFVLCVYLTFNYVAENNYSTGGVLERITTFNFEVFEDNARGQLWKDGIEWTFINVLGSGAGNEKFIYRSLNSQAGEAHNIFVSAFIQFGFLGFALILCVMIALFSKIIKFRNSNYMILYVAFLMFFSLQILKGSFLQTRLFWQPITILLILLNHQKHYTPTIKLKKN